MRSFLSVFAALLIPISLAACGGGSSTETTAAVASSAAATAAAETAAATEASTSAAAAETAAAATSEPAPVGPTITTIEPDVLTVGTELPDPPFVNADTYDAISTDGYEVEMVNEIAKRLGLSTVKWVEFPFNGLIAGSPCPCDFDVNGVTAYEDRKEKMDFSTSYFKSNQAALAQKDITIPDTAAAKALKWGVTKDSSGAYYVDVTLQPTAKPRVYDSPTAAFLALKAKQVDAVMLDVPIALDGASKNPDTAVVGQFETGEDYGIVLAKDSPNTEVISEIVDQLRTEGFFDGLLAKYFPNNVDIPIVK